MGGTLKGRKKQYFAMYPIHFLMYFCITKNLANPYISRFCEVLFSDEAWGIRTPDNLIKSQA